MSFITYLCWLLGISVPSDCDSNSYQGWVTDSCETAEEAQQANAPKDEGQKNANRHASQQRTNIDVSI